MKFSEDKMKLSIVFKYLMCIKYYSATFDLDLVRMKPNFIEFFHAEYFFQFSTI